MKKKGLLIFIALLLYLFTAIVAYYLYDFFTHDMERVDRIKLSLILGFCPIIGGIVTYLIIIIQSKNRK